jgi:hypothetical protein
MKQGEFREQKTKKGQGNRVDDENGVGDGGGGGDSSFIIMPFFCKILAMYSYNSVHFTSTVVL